MANFNTHLITASAVAGVVASGMMQADLADPSEAVLYFGLGTLGGILPDVDSDNSIVTRILFTVLAVLGASLCMFLLVDYFYLFELLIIATGFFLFINIGVTSFFKHYTVHRGLFHSVPAGLLAWMLTTLFTFHILHYTDFASWACGMFIFLGYIIHLLLDEIFSVDISNKRIKRSFGTAMKLADTKQMPASFMLYAAAAIMLVFLPSATEFFNTLMDYNLYSTIQNNFLPDGSWFESITNQIGK